MLIIFPTLPEYEPPLGLPLFSDLFGLESFFEGPLSPSEFSFANVCAPALPSASIPLLLWNLFSAASVISPKYPVAFDSFKYPALARRDCSLATCSFWSPSTSPFAFASLERMTALVEGPK